MIDILSPDFHQNPYAHYKTIRDEYPLFFHEKTGMYILSRYDDVTAASNNPAFSTRHYEQNFEPLAGERIVLTMEGKEHTVKRNFISNPIRGRELEEKMLPAIKRIAEELFDAFPNKQDVDFVKDFTAKFPVNVIVAVLELPPSDYPLFHDWYSRMSAYFTNISKDPAIIADGELLVKEMEAYLAPIIEERKRNPGTDVISLMCTTEQYSSMTTNKEIQAVCATYLSAGGDTTDKTLRSLLVNLLNHPEQLEMVRKDRSLVNNAIAETLRFSPPLHMLLRLTIEDIETPHGVIPKGSMVNTLLGAANRDDRKFENPDSFNILRTDLNIKNAFSGAANHTTFGSGRHFCAGAMLAAAEMNIALNLFLDRTESIELLNEIEEEGIFIRAPKAVRLALHLKSEKNGGEETAVAPSAPPPQCPFHGSHSN